METIKWVLSVSYTHLDVYKRQVQDDSDPAHVLRQSRRIDIDLCRIIRHAKAGSKVSARKDNSWIKERMIR